MRSGPRRRPRRPGSPGAGDAWTEHVVARRLVDEELALDLHGHVPVWRRGRYRSAQMGERGHRSGRRRPIACARPHFERRVRRRRRSVTTSTVLDTFDGRLHAAGLRLEHDGTRSCSAGRRGRAPSCRSPAPAVRRRPAARPVPVPPRRHHRGPRPAALATVTTKRGDERATATARSSPASTIHEATARRTARRRVARRGRRADRLREAGRRGARSCAARVVTEDDDLVDIGAGARRCRPGRAPHDPTVPLDPDLPAIEGFRAVLANLDDAIEANWPGTIDDIDPEFLHDLRVAVRRTRSVLRHGKRAARRRAGVGRGRLSALGDVRRARPRPRRVRARVGRLHGALGAGDAAALEPVRGQLDEDRARRARGLAAERAPARSALLERWSAWLADDPAPPVRTPADPLGDVVARRIRKAQRRLIEHGRAIRRHPRRGRPRSAQGRQEAALPAGVLRRPAPDADASAFVKRLKALQDNLGEHQDAEVHVAQLRSARRRAAGDDGRRDARGDRPARRAARAPAIAEARTSSPSGSPPTTARRPRQALRGDARQGRAGEGRRHLQHQGRGREDDRRGQPRLRGGSAGRAGAPVGPRPAGCGHVLRPRQAAVKGGAERLVSGRAGSADHVRATDVAGLHVVPADFSLRHLDLHLDDTPDPAARRRCSTRSPTRYDVALLDCPPGITLTSESVFGAADALLVPTIPSTLSARTLEQLTAFLGRSTARRRCCRSSRWSTGGAPPPRGRRRAGAAWPQLLAPRSPARQRSSGWASSGRRSVVCAGERGAARLPRPVGRDRRPPLADPVRATASVGLRSSQLRGSGRSRLDEAKVRHGDARSAV